MIVGGVIFIFFTSSITELILVASIQKTEDMNRKNNIETLIDK